MRTPATTAKARKHAVAQQDFLDRVNAAGGIGVCVHSVDELEEEIEPFLIED